MFSVVIADNEYLEREVIKRVISKIDNFAVICECNTGEKAMELCKAIQPDFVFIKFRLSGIDSLHAAKKIHDINKEIIVILISACHETLLDESISNKSINNYFLKPLKPCQIENLINSYKNNFSENHEKLGSNKKNLKFYPKHLMSKEIAAALEYIDIHFTENISLEIICDKVFLSSYYFSRLFKKEVGVTFSSYIVHKKILEAKNLLENTDRSILNISTHLSFNEQSYFCKVFKKTVGITPTEYRDSFKNDAHSRIDLVNSYTSSILPTI